MAFNVLAPGVISKIQDLSDYVDAQPATTGFVAMICEKGPDNQIVRVTRSSFFKLFGEPDINYTNSIQFGMGPYVASNFLQESDSLFVCRALPEEATYANLFITTTDVIDVDSTADQTLTCDTLSASSNISTLSDITGQLSNEVDTSSAGYALVGFYGIGRGEFYNDYQIDLNAHPNNASLSNNPWETYIIDIYRKQRYSSRFAPADNTSGGNDYTEYSIVETFSIAFDPKAVDEFGSSLFIEDVINTYSEHIRCKAASSVLADLTKRHKEGTLTINFAEGFIQSYTAESGVLDLGYGINLDNGSSGDMFTSTGLSTDTTSESYAGNVLARVFYGTLVSSQDSELTLDNITDVENIQFDLVFDCGYPKNVKTAIVNLANVRLDCMAILDNGDHKSASAAITDRTGSGSNSTFSYNSPYAALYEPYSKIYDVFTGRDIWVPPSFHMARIIAYSDKNTELWYAPAGLQRAIIQNLKELRYNPSNGDRESFIKYQINPIVKFGEGFTAFSQRTTMKTSSARQDINVTRLICFIDRTLKTYVKRYIFEFNDRDTWAKISQEINRFLREIRNRRALYSFSVSVHASDYDIKLRRINVDIMLEPVRAIEQIFLNFFIK